MKASGNHYHSPTQPKVVITAILATLLFAAFLCPPIKLLPLTVTNLPNSISRRQVRRRMPDGSFNNIFYWTPHKTSSSAIRGFFKRLAVLISYKIETSKDSYPYGKKDLLRHTLSGTPGTIYTGHVHVKNTVGGVHAGMIPPNTFSVSSIRKPFNTMTSKYFHRTPPQLLDPSDFEDYHAPHARFWFFYFHDYNRCEPLEYYDGDMNCDINMVEDRIERISDMIDCVVDADDAQADFNAICAKFKSSECPEAITANVAGVALYEELHKIDHIREIMVNASGPTTMLYNRLKKKRCRFELSR